MSEPLPRRPRRKKSKLLFMGEVLGNFLVVNVMVAVMGALLVVPQQTMGSTASAHVDPTTGKPVLQELEGCRLVPPAKATGGDER